MKSLQIVLNEWSERLSYRVSASALSQARRKLLHTAFIELLEEVVIKPMYQDDEFDSYRGRRLLAIDGTTLRLPNTEETRGVFGVVPYMNGSRQKSEQVEGKLSVLYDVLNRIPLAADLCPGRTHELKAAAPQLEKFRDGDIILADRGYNAYRFFAEL